MLAINRYSASADSLDIMDCFLDFNEMREDLRNAQTLEMNRQVSKHATQSESANAFKLSFTFGWEEKALPWRELDVFQYASAYL